MNLIKTDEIHSKIFTIRGKQVMLDRDLAGLYNVQTKVLNQAVKRNKDRFPENFSFQLNHLEFTNWRSQIVTSNSEKMGIRHLPNVFTEQGVAMLSAVLRSETAIQVSIQIIETFVKIRNEVHSNSEILNRLLILENKQVETDKTVNKILQSFDKNPQIPSKGIFFEGQLFDAYVFTINLIKSAKKSIILIDNYVDETTLLMLSKRDENCQAIIYTHKINAQLQLDIAKYNEQYPSVDIKPLKLSHDRFLIIDHKELYHFGASIKDLGKKWFAFSKINEFLPELLKKLDVLLNE
jgi:hypothetical protein